MLAPKYTPHFRDDVRRVAKRGYDMLKLTDVILLLLTNNRPLPAQYRDHPLKGQWKNHRELHIESDWLLIYYLKDEDCVFVTTGTHAELFGK